MFPWYILEDRQLQQIVDVIIHKVYKNYKCDARTQGQAENGEHLALRQSILGLSCEDHLCQEQQRFGGKKTSWCKHMAQALWWEQERENIWKTQKNCRAWNFNLSPLTTFILKKGDTCNCIKSLTLVTDLQLRQCWHMCSISSSF